MINLKFIDDKNIPSISEIIADKLIERKWTADDAAKKMGGDFYFNLMVLQLWLACGASKENIIMTDDCALNFESAFDVHASFFKSLHQKWLDADYNHRKPFECPDWLFGTDMIKHHN